MNRLRLAIVGFGRLGQACAHALREAPEFELAGVVRRTRGALPHPFEHVAVAGHPRELERASIALVCVPAQVTLQVARELLQQRLPLVECAALEGGALAAHHRALGEAARRHRVAAVVGAGWQPGALPLLQRVFETLIPRGQTETSTHPGVTLHRTAALQGIAGVQAALACERRAADGRPQRYLYVQLAQGASLAEVERHVRGDPLYAGEETELFQVDDVASLEAAASGIVLERRGTGEAEAHQSLLLEARFDAVRFAARVMLDAARQLPQLRPGAHAWLPRA
ncbi:MAG TPA: hypothetical protein VEG36_09710 [Burkholderiales bacterium]|nr:hypothetical protein [Burkholderiales bacterium]